ncbi:thiamine pyrophosphate-dependent dehydrogenase E1 component subunit alpha [Parafrankia sp. EUN1f]|uniref:thiamine pyrophosphate-dependent dehydrogenase E1 component subunit alpha n=1 Tax=Parafrankia sp. EUN1f TaxID=102897 RepID=UPI0018DC797E|nr:thiamine pyrophosphate-dependent dehydrogenase E1 component subunit alpha [Parafrankia sp. EUN1f]
MRLIAAVDQRINQEVRAGTLNAATYPVRGLEGSCAAVGLNLRPVDQLVSTYRNLGDALAKGSSLDALVAEIYGRLTGASKGKGGAMHLQDQSVGFVTSTGIVGSGIPIAVGLGVAAQLDGSDRVVVTTFGDGATSIGAFHESMNLASLWRLPVIFVCQNNQWGEHTPIAEYAASTDLAGRAAAYAMASARVDGFDPIATALEVRVAVERARRGEGPTFLEVVTYRLTGHSGVSDYSYVPKDALARALERDPVPTFRRRMVEQGVAPVAEIEEIDSQIAAEVDAAFSKALEEPFPPPSERFTDVFADERLVQGL